MQTQTVHNQELVYLFKRMLYYRDSTTDMARLGPWLQRELSTIQFPNLAHLPFEPKAYTRTCIAKEGTINTAITRNEPEARYEALVMRWDQQVKTSIHGHPRFSLYHVISGLFEIETFEQKRGQSLELKETQQLRAAETTWFLGQAKRYDNCIHRVTCLKPGFTFHIYSEDARKGKVYD
ncbi:MAG: hypothetical protein AAGC93_14335 [Cyanobacteria bacterium P01_F01_bin.53]